MNGQKIYNYFEEEILDYDNKLKLLDQIKDRRTYRELLSKKIELESKMNYFYEFPFEFSDFLRDDKLRKGADKYKNKYPLNFIDNYLFVLPNKNKKFSDSEIAALIISNSEMSLNSKIEALKQINNKDLTDDINKWIEYKKYCVSFISNLNNSKYYFIINGHSYSFSSLKEALKSKRDLALTSGISIPSIDGAITSISFVNNYECDDLMDLISEIRIAKNAFVGFNYYLSPLYRLGVLLNHPFKKFDCILLPDSSDFYSHVVVADEKDPKVNALMPSDKPLGRFKLNIYNYYLETNAYSSNGVKEGELAQSFRHEYYCSDLKSIRFIKKTEMTIKEKMMIAEIKKQYNNRKKIVE